MKKLLFTAFAVMVFSGVSFANTSKNKEEEKEILVFTDCGRVASLMMDICEEINGCQESGDYNAGYDTWKGLCDHGYL
ncbi:hypothetical protein [Flavobacterium piscis]|uniref:Uncharacterized protein n=1 Tax=Flavobacterium piscis TaxID=1114874 RepID=A0ABU1Y1N1_9FLAO|nr:hypothetical protein [Flavobacterium piscis]MDR7208130.1 hypothetical protein [Flavobacterium piscis]